MVYYICCLTIDFHVISISETWLEWDNCELYDIPDSKVHGANMEPTWVLSAPDGPHVGPMNLAIREDPQE